VRGASGGDIKPTLLGGGEGIFPNPAAEHALRVEVHHDAALTVNGDDATGAGRKK